MLRAAAAQSLHAARSLPGSRAAPRHAHPRCVRAQRCARVGCADADAAPHGCCASLLAPGSAARRASAPHRCARTPHAPWPAPHVRACARACMPAQGAGAFVMAVLRCHSRSLTAPCLRCVALRRAAQMTRTTSSRRSSTARSPATRRGLAAARAHTHTRIPRALTDPCPLTRARHAHPTRPRAPDFRDGARARLPGRLPHGQGARPPSHTAQRSAHIHTSPTHPLMRRATRVLRCLARRGMRC
jgi:hypothetical protein